MVPVSVINTPMLFKIILIASFPLQAVGNEVLRLLCPPFLRRITPVPTSDKEAKSAFLESAVRDDIYMKMHVGQSHCVNSSVVHEHSLASSL
jgi:hypothetical protein